MLKQFRAAIFDLDGTLVDSMGMWLQIDIDYLARYGLEVPDDLQKDIEGFSFSETANYFKNRFNLTDDVEKIKADWNEMAHEFYKNKVQIKANVKELLEYLKNSGYEMAIATSNSKYLAELALLSNDISDYFKYLVTSCDVNKGKPSPDVYLKAVDLLGCNVTECIAFEDTVAGVKAAKAAGIYTVGIFDKHSEKYETEIREFSDKYILNYNEIF